MLASPACCAPFDKLYVAYSGGVDSTALLHWAYNLKRPIVAIHIHHGLHPNADQWAQHCQSTCDHWDIPLIIHSLTHLKADMANLEAKARYARYQAFTDIIAHSQAPCLLMGHHLDDQIETLLFHVWRNTGLHALQGIPKQRMHHHFTLLRPLLAQSKTTIEKYAQHHRLNWIEDSSNNNTYFRRNYMRHCIKPHLDATLYTTLHQLQRLAQLHERLMHHMTQYSIKHQPNWPAQYQLRHWHALDQSCQYKALRLWLDALKLTAPRQAHLRTLYQQLTTLSCDQQLLWQHDGCQIRCYRDTLYATDTAQPPTCPIAWQPPYHPITISGVCYHLVEDPTGFKLPPQATLWLHFRKGGERFKPRNHRHHLELKHYLQSMHVPPWQRYHLPLIHLNDQCIAIADLSLTDKAQTPQTGEKGYRIVANKKPA